MKIAFATFLIDIPNTCSKGQTLQAGKDVPELETLANEGVLRVTKNAPPAVIYVPLAHVAYMVGG